MDDFLESVFWILVIGVFAYFVFTELVPFFAPAGKGDSLANSRNYNVAAGIYKGFWDGLTGGSTYNPAQVADSAANAAVFVPNGSAAGAAIASSIPDAAYAE